MLWAGGFDACLWAAVVYSAVGPGAAANLLQMKGQRIVPAAEAQVIFATTPVFNAGISVAFLGGGCGGAHFAGGRGDCVCFRFAARSSPKGSATRRNPLSSQSIH